MLKYQYTNYYDKEYKIKKRKIECFSKSELEKAHPDGNYVVVGETIIRNKKDKIDFIELGGVKLTVSEADEHSKILFKTAGYIRVDGGNYVKLLKRRWGLLLWLLALILLLAIAYIFLHHPAVVPKPDTTKVDTDTVFISLPRGNVDYRLITDVSQFDGYDMDLYMEHDDREDLIHQQEILLTGEGDIEDGTLDFTSLTFELLEGDYEGRMVYKADGEKDSVLPVKILVRSATEGKLPIGYSNQIKVNKKAGKLSLRYELGKKASHDVMIQAILVKNKIEYLLGQSDIIHAGEKVTRLKLNKSEVKNIKSGNYDGIIRVYIVNGTGGAADAGTDIKLHVKVK